MRSILVMVMAAIMGCGHEQPDVHILPDAAAPPDGLAPFGACDLFAQTGCNAGDKCTWLVESITQTYAGRIGCAPAGKVPIGGACMMSMPGTTPGFDDCTAGSVCSNYRTGPGVCKAICDPAGGAPACDGSHSCMSYSGLFTATNGMTMTIVGGVCDPICSPLDDNDFDGAEPTLTRVGITCGAAGLGCYGLPSYGASRPTAWSCAPDIEYVDTIRRQGGQSNGYINGCNQGYIPLGDFMCHALCAPGNTYQGNAGTQFPQGQALHRCNTTDARGGFTGNEHCVYLWRLEINASGHFTRSPTSDNLGVCISDPNLPSCENLPLTGTTSAADYGCVDTATAPTLPASRLSIY